MSRFIVSRPLRRIVIEGNVWLAQLAAGFSIPPGALNPRIGFPDKAADS